MTQEIVNYFTSRGIRVMLSIGGITYVDPWNQALAEDAAQLGRNAAAVAQRLGVGMGIDYEANTGADLNGLQSFITAYRAVLPFDPSGTNPAARLTIDVAAGDRWLIDINRKATAVWSANASSSRLSDRRSGRPFGRETSMVPRSRPSSRTGTAWATVPSGSS